MDKIFKALADSTRRVMLDKLLAEPGLTLSELVAGTDMRRQSASKHLRILEEAGLLHTEWRGREKVHFLNPVPIQDISRRWVDKFSATRADALLTMKVALEESEAKPDQLPEIPKGPAVTSFFTPIED